MEKIVNIPNLLTICRAFLAFSFLIDNPYVRSTAVILAAISDGLDGFLARLWKQESRFGRALDPIVDKFFVFFAISVLLLEQKVGSYEVFAVITRDIILILFGVYISLSGKWYRLRIHSSKVGKLVTLLQFALLVALCFQWEPPVMTYGLFALLGCCMLVELMLSRRFIVQESS